MLDLLLFNLSRCKKNTLDLNFEKNLEFGLSARQLILLPLQPLYVACICFEMDKTNISMFEILEPGVQLWASTAFEES